MLGFEVREPEGDPSAVEVVSGKAIIRFGAHSYEPNEWNQPKTPGSAILYFEMDNVEVMHAAVRGRGGTPSGLEKINLLKINMFEIRAPDGHTLWFGQSLDEPDTPPPPGPLEKIMPELPLSGVPAGVAYYRDILGFQVNYQQTDIGATGRDEIRLLIVARSERHRGIGSAYVYVRDADALHAELCETGASLQGEPVSQPWGFVSSEW